MPLEQRKRRPASTFSLQVNLMRLTPACLGLAMLVLCGCERHEPRRAPAPAAAHAEGAGDSAAACVRETAESAARAFLLAPLTGSRVEFEAVILTYPQAEVLWSGAPVPSEGLEIARAKIQAAQLRPLSVGEAYSVAGEGCEVTADQVGEGRALLVALLDGRPVAAPISLVLTADGWRVDAASIIEAMLAAQRGTDGADAETNTGGDAADPDATAP